MILKEEIYNNFVNDFSNVLREKTETLDFTNIVFLCIGTDRVNGDCFGPLVGYKLINLFEDVNNIDVIGSLDEPVSTYNITDIIKNIDNTSLVIAIDAAISNKKQIGNIVVSNKAMNIGDGIYKRNINVGHISIKGIVSKDLNNPKYNFRLLQNTSLRPCNEHGRSSSTRNMQYN